MQNPSRDNAREAEIQDLIAKREFKEAFEKICSTYRDEIERRCKNGLYGYADDHTADGKDLAQEILAEFYKNIRKYDPHIAGVRTFLFRITTYRITDRRRKIISKRNFQEAVSQEMRRRASIEAKESYWWNPELMISEKERKKRLECALDEISVPDKLIINLILHDFKIDEISQITGMNAGTIRQRLRRMRHKLDNEDFRGAGTRPRFSRAHHKLDNEDFMKEERLHDSMLVIITMMIRQYFGAYDNLTNRNLLMMEFYISKRIKEDDELILQYFKAYEHWHKGWGVHDTIEAIFQGII